MDRILRGLRGGSDATDRPDAPAHQEDSPMQLQPPRYEPQPEGDADISPVAAVAKRSDILKVSARSRPSAVAGAIEIGRAHV